MVLKFSLTASLPDTMSPCPCQEVFHIEPGNPSNAFLEFLAVAARKIGPPDSLVKHDIAGEKDLSIRPVKANGTGGMAWRMDDLKIQFPHLQVPFLEEDSGFKIRDPKCLSVVEGDGLYEFHFPG